MEGSLKIHIDSVATGQILNLHVDSTAMEESWKLHDGLGDIGQPVVGSS